jgi:hypothetical protein
VLLRFGDRTEQSFTAAGRAPAAGKETAAAGGAALRVRQEEEKSESF